MSGKNGPPKQGGAFFSGHGVHSVRREYQVISLANSPTNHTPPRYYTICPTTGARNQHSGRPL